MSIFAKMKGRVRFGWTTGPRMREHSAMVRMLVLFATMMAGPALAQGPALPVHGNWCGPNHGAGPIVDALDDACMRHDYCTMQLGRLDCGCDLAFMTELRQRAWPNPAMAGKARAVYEAIALTPCDGAPGQQAKFELAAGDWARAVATGREPPWAFLERLGALMADGVRRAY